MFHVPWRCPAPQTVPLLPRPRRLQSCFWVLACLSLAPSLLAQAKTGAYIKDKPQSLLIAGIEDYQARKDSRPNHTEVHRTGNDIAGFWTSVARPALGLPRVEHLKDGQVTSALFTGKNAKCTEYDLVLFSGHGSPDGPWLGNVPDQGSMVPANYHWSSGKTKWFINAGCLGLFDKVTTPNAGANMEELKAWQQAMGHDPSSPSRLHGLMGFRSLGYQTVDFKFKNQWGSGSVSGGYTANPHRIFIHMLMIDEKAKAEAQKPVKMGDTWFFAAASQWACFGTDGGSTPGYLRWIVKNKSDQSVAYDYFNETFSDPYPDPASFASSHDTELLCDYQTFGKPRFQ